MYFNNFDKFTSDDSYSVGWAETDDPRLLAVIVRDNNAEAPDGDCFAPAITSSEWWYNERFATPVKSVWEDDAAWSAIRSAWDEHGYSDDPSADANVQLLDEHGITLHLVRSSIDQYDHVWIVDSPAFRTAMGIEPDADSADVVRGDVETWKAFLDNDVYGVGYATQEARTTHETPVNFADFEVEIECWGFYGSEYAATTALAFEHGSPDLHPMLDHTEPKAA
jgi:hypothetical protein